LAVVGHVGSGKSSLLMALLGEMPNIHGNVTMNGMSVFYVSQESWIFSATVKQNILFGKPYDKDKFSQIVKICALKDDLKILPNGENTIIGDKGVNLSGGQRARVSLARALYHDPDVYLLDDPLSAVDANVAKHLFDK
jgi:ABC-type multidrug transport system fused ATPase/permease subunit